MGFQIWGRGSVAKLIKALLLKEKIKENPNISGSLLSLDNLTKKLYTNRCFIFDRIEEGRFVSVSSQLTTIPQTERVVQSLMYPL